MMMSHQNYSMQTCWLLGTVCKHKTTQCRGGTVQAADQLTLRHTSGDKRVGVDRVTKI